MLCPSPKVYFPMGIIFSYMYSDLASYIPEYRYFLNCFNRVNGFICSFKIAFWKYSVSDNFERMEVENASGSHYGAGEEERLLTLKYSILNITQMIFTKKYIFTLIMWYTDAHLASQPRRKPSHQGTNAIKAQQQQEGVHRFTSGVHSWGYWEGGVCFSPFLGSF